MLGMVLWPTGAMISGFAATGCVLFGIEIFLKIWIMTFVNFAFFMVILILVIKSYF
jgi:hypothetical protein